ncbi:glycoside hydrolase family 16 protein [Jaapia argillacea MUCL 33604]|uniref:Glycoside hydrolase family 16 protein n=1 Tax=Jaapia argillacea MUCL 33604 TaxID=933084 RepID=A0A067Q448_9AGAM|nr:glycoside hydrolase family 16 protein [Jaapia argillacea MUCL 33604]
MTGASLLSWGILTILLVLSYLPGGALGDTYGLTDSISGSSFLSTFSHEAIPDPTHGRVKYVDQATAQRLNLTYASGKHFIIRADHTTVLDPNGAGRDSVRLQSLTQYNTHVAVFNINHMPQGCGTWPAVWEVGANWPNGGEIDILEGVNDVSPNQVTLHTAAGCSVPAQRFMTGTSTGTDCNVATTGNAGCGVKVNDNRSYGSAFNSNGGGWYAIEKTDDFVKIWFWPRNGGGVPGEVSSGSDSIDTTNWGTPSAYFPNAQCNVASHFSPQNIIINLTFCGDWAGSAYSGSGCPGSCVDYVNNNPSAFKNAYFDFAWLKIYQ